MRTRTLALVATAVALGFTSQASALTYTLNDSFGSDPVSGEIDIDISVAGDGSSMTILIDTTDLSSPEFIKELYLNSTGTADFGLTGADFASSTASLDSVSFGQNAFKSDGDGYHDIFLQFDETAGNRLEAGAVYTVVINGVGLTEEQFNDRGTASTKGHFHAVAKVNSTGGGGGSDWVGDGGPPIPEPSGVLLFGLGTTIVGARLRRRRS